MGKQYMRKRSVIKVMWLILATAFQDMDKLKCIQRTATKMIMALKEQLMRTIWRCWVCLALEKNKLAEHHKIAIFMWKTDSTLFQKQEIKVYNTREKIQGSIF